MNKVIAPLVLLAIALGAQYVNAMDPIYVVHRAAKDGSSGLEQLGTAHLSDANGPHYCDRMVGVDGNYVYLTLDDASAARMPRTP